ncbi:MULTISPECIES: hypothetical protein [unclassified Mesorhizobium]|uniref:hypothetical protein n=1 Tax=unclassified Mesorhizobium TaxID=325217 RepID=UPI0013DFE930|nr:MULTISPECIES: hypothetical protein [unclassified Mesorhizobium]
MQHANDFISIGGQARTKRSSDQTRRAGDEDPHLAPENCSDSRASSCLHAEPDETAVSLRSGRTIERFRAPRRGQMEASVAALLARPARAPTVSSNDIERKLGLIVPLVSTMGADPKLPRMFLQPFMGKASCSRRNDRLGRFSATTVSTICSCTQRQPT